MIFSQEQIDEIVRIIRFQNVFFIAGNIGTSVLKQEDIQVLKDFGIDPTSLNLGLTPFEQLFYFGRLASMLGPLNASQVTFSDLKKYFQRGQYVPLSDAETASLRYLQGKSYNYIKGLGETEISFITGKIEDENLAKRSYYESIIGDSLKRTIIERDSVRNIVSEIGEKTGDWNRDLGRIAETELQNAYEYGKAASYDEIYGDKVLYYKEVYPGACQYCIKLYLTNGIGSEPRLFTYEQLLQNGTNIGKKSRDWLPVLGTVHPFCFDDQTEVLTDQGWKFFKDLNKTEKFLSVDLETGEGEWCSAVNWVSQEYKGKMYLRENKSFSLCTTPNHYHVVNACYEGARDKLRQEGDIPVQGKFLCTLPKWTGIPMDFFEIGNLKYDINLFCEFLGYYLSEGSVSNYKGTYRISITQIKDSRHKIFECCKSLFGDKCSLQKECIEVYINKERRPLWDYLKKFGHSHEKFIPLEVKNLPVAQLNIFLDAYFLGDGTYFKGCTWKGYKCNGYRTITSSSYRMISDLSEIILKIGKRPSLYNFGKNKFVDKRQGKIYEGKHDVWQVSELKSKYAYNTSLKKRLIDYEGYIYDVELEKNHTLFVKRNNKVCVSGNCRCDLRIYRKGDEWDPDKGMYVTKKSSTQSKGTIKISVGDKIFKV